MSAAQVKADKVHAINCEACGKLFRLKAMPVDAAGRVVMMFKMTCLRCGYCGIYDQQDIHAFTRPLQAAGHG